MSRSPNTRLETTHTSLTMSDFDPEHEAIVSTRQIDQSDQLPELPKSFRKSQSPPRQEPDYAIDTSTIERAFPEFSDIESSGDNDDDSEISVEVGRGAKLQHRLDDSRNSILSAEENVRASSPAIRIDYPVTTGASKSAMRSSSRRVSGTDNLRKDAQIRRASQVLKEHADSASSGRAKGSSGRAAEGRRTLSEMHAKVRDTYDGSYISDERPQAFTVNTRATRFSNVSAQVAAAVDQASRDARDRRSSRYVSANGTYTASTIPENGTYQSFVLPDLPNLSDLVSGVYEDGTPVFSRQNKRSTRFVSPPPDDRDESGHVPVEAVPIPEDEKVLFVSLKLMQEKVAALEMAKTEAEKRLDELRQENHQLRTEKSRRQKEQYDRVKMFGGDEGRIERLLQERTKLDAANMELQNRLDIAERKIQVHESTIKTLAQERDSAVSQLGVAYLHTQDIKAENDSLRKENAELKAQLAKLTALLQKLTGQDTDTRRSATGEWTTEGDTGDVTADSTRRSNDQSRSRERPTTEGSRARISSQIDKVMAKIEKERQEAELFDVAKPSRSSQHKAKSEDRKASSSGEKKPNTGKQRVKRVIVEDVDITDRATEENHTEEARSQVTEDKDLTFLSFMDEREIAQLRRKLEEELVARKQRQAKDVTGNTTGNTTSGSRRLVSDPPRRSSLKEPKEKIARPSSALGEVTTTSRTDEPEEAPEHEAARRRRHSDHSITSRSRRRNHMTEMTSAIILPDITLHTNASEPTRQSEPAQQALDHATRHDGGNCTVCKRALDGTNHDHTHTDEKHETVNVPKPIPVSERMPKPGPYQEDPTIRPAEPPGVALATILKSLEDELSHLKMQLARYQTAYNKHDASLGKRRRKALARKIETLLREIDTKSDQIYALYDVLEGQKQSGQEMTEKEVEITLQSIGINVAHQQQQRDLTERTDVSTKRHASSVQQQEQQQQDEDEDEDDSELPWEGIESTGEVTG